MKKLRRFSMSLLAAVLALAMLTACDGGGSTGSGSKPTNPGSSAPTNPEQPGGSTPGKPASSSPEEYPKTWAESKTKKYLADRGITETNLYVVYDTILEEQVEVTYSVRNGRSAAEGKLKSNQSQMKSLQDEKGNGYDIDYKEKTVTVYPAGNNDISETIETARFLAMLPTDSNVGSMSATDYAYKGATYYMESFKLNTKLSGRPVTGTWDYLYAGNELKYIITETYYGSTAEIKSISANPPDSCFALPNWYSDSGDVTRTLRYFKENNITENNFYLRGRWNENSGIICTVDGEKAYCSQSHPSGTEPDTLYVPKSGEIYRLYEQQKKYKKEMYYSVEEEKSVRTGWDTLDVSVLSDYFSRKSGAYNSNQELR